MMQDEMAAAVAYYLREIIGSHRVVVRGSVVTVVQCVELGESFQVGVSRPVGGPYHGWVYPVTIGGRRAEYRHKAYEGKDEAAKRIVVGTVRHMLRRV